MQEEGWNGLAFNLADVWQTLLKSLVQAPSIHVELLEMVENILKDKTHFVFRKIFS